MKRLVSRARSNYWVVLVVRSLAVAFIVATVAFSILRLAPGDPVATILGDQATPEAVARLRSQLGLDGNLLQQYLAFIGGLFQGDLGVSVTSRVPVVTIIVNSIGPTLALIAVSSVIGFLVSVPLGLFLALRPRSVLTKSVNFVSTLSLSTPGFYLGLLALMLFAVALGIAPVAGYDPSFPGMLRYLWLPALVVCGQLIPVLSRVFRTSVQRTLGEEFTEAAIVRGIPRWRYYVHYLVRPSLAPTIALLGYVAGQLLSSAVMIEMVFGFPGIGTQLVRAVSTRDYPTVQGIVLVFGVFVVLITALSEAVSTRIDHRIGRETP
jgi:ABC-type dipeptide/oligopeptide/nickel transport systems, permease components